MPLQFAVTVPPAATLAGATLRLTPVGGAVTVNAALVARRV